MKNKILFLGLSILFLGACSSDPVDKDIPSDTVVTADTVPTQYAQVEVIEKPFDNIDVPFKTFNYNNKKGSTIELPSGTLIEIPKKAFEDENGNAVNENIEIKYREFHDIGDVMLSGIKMDYEGSDFESAGMFEIRAEESGKELSLKEDKSINIEMASYTGGEFDSFGMNEETKEWEYIEKSEAKPNSRKKERQKKNLEAGEKLVLECTDGPREMKAGDKIVDIDFSISRHKELDLFNGAMWIIKGSENDRRRFNQDRKKYNDLSLVPIDETCNEYTLNLWKRDSWDKEKDTNKTTYIVEPVWSGNEYRLAKKDYKKRNKEYKKEAKRIEKERRSLEREADLVRSFSLKGMGIYNCDRTIDYIKMVAAGIIISCKEKIKNWWYITMNKKVAIKYWDPNSSDFKYNPNSDNSVMAILPNDKVGIVTPAEFERSYEAYRKSEDPNKVMEVDMIIEGESMAERKQFKEHISRF
ncbi:MAG: hypothetical protein ACI857_001168 [Arenicella sp.]|jgi:hypothetical protein